MTRTPAQPLSAEPLPLRVGGGQAPRLHPPQNDMAASPRTSDAVTAAQPAPEPLLPRVARGESEAVRACLGRYGGLVWSLARRTLGSGPEAEDLVQEVFIELWRKAGRFDPAKGKETTFVAVLTRRRLIDKLRRKSARPDGRPSPIDALDETGKADARRTDPAAPAELADEMRRVHAAMGRLKPDQASALRLAVCDGLTHEQTAAKLDLPLGTVKTHVRRGLQKLRALLASETEVVP